MSRNWVTLFPQRRRRSFHGARSVEAVESRFVLSTLDPLGTAGLLQPPETPATQTGTQPPVGYQLPGGGSYQPPQQTVTGTVSIGLNYQSLNPDLVFNGVGDQTIPGILRYDSAVPFQISGRSSGPARLVVIYPNGRLMETNVNGEFSCGAIVNTSEALGTELDLKAHLFSMPNSSQAGQLIASATKTEALNIQTFRFEDYLGKLGGKADTAVTDQINSLVDSVFGPLLTDDVVTQIAQTRFGGIPTSAQEDQIRQEIEDAKDYAAGRLDGAGRFALQHAITGNKLEQKFVFGAGHPSGGAFSNALAASKAAYNNEFEFGNVKDWVGLDIPMPSTDTLKSGLSTLNSVEDVRSYFNSVPLTLKIDGPQIQILDGVSFQAQSNFVSQSLITESPSLSAFDVSAGLNFFPPVSGPPVLGGLKMRGRFGGFYRKSLSESGLPAAQGGDADMWGIRGGIEY